MSAVPRTRARRSPLLAVLAVLGALLAGSFLQAPAAAQTPQPPTLPPPRPNQAAPVLLVLDASGSMRADDGTGRSKLDAAKEALLRLVEELPDGTQVGLRVYGHRVPRSQGRTAGCGDTELVAPVAPLDRARLRTAIQGFEANGYTPIGASLRAALNDMPGTGPRTVVLISDGIDTCAPPDPCSVATELTSGGVELRVESIGFQVDAAAAEQLRCISEVTGGAFRSVDDSAGLLRALREYRVVGTAITGGEGPEDALVLEAGTYRDTLVVGEERWYAVDLEPGELLRTVSTLVGERGGPVAPAGVLYLDVGEEDLLGALACGRDQADRIGQEARQVNVDGAAAQEGAICRKPGRTFIRLALEDGEDPEESVLAGRTYDVELLLNVAEGVTPRDEEAPLAEVTAQLDQEQLDSGPRTSTVVGTGVLAAILGIVAGGLAARRYGP